MCIRVQDIDLACFPNSPVKTHPGRTLPGRAHRYKPVHGRTGGDIGRDKEQWFPGGLGRNHDSRGLCVPVQGQILYHGPPHAMYRPEIVLQAAWERLWISKVFRLRNSLGAVSTRCVYWGLPPVPPAPMRLSSCYICSLHISAPRDSTTGHPRHRHHPGR